MSYLPITLSVDNYTSGRLVRVIKANNMSEASDNLFERLVKTIQEENKKQTLAINNTLKTEIDYIKKEITQVKEVIEEETNKNLILLEKHRKVENRCILLERSCRKNNIIIFGLKDDVENIVQYTIDKINELLQLNLDINNFNNIRLIGNPQKQRPLLVEFVSFLTKLEVCKNCYKLKGTGVSISDDLCPEDRQTRKLLLEHQKQARSKGMRSFVRGQKLIINDEVFTLETLERQEENTENAPLEINEIFNEIEIGERTTDEIEETEDIQSINKKRKLSKTDPPNTRPFTRNQSQERKGHLTKNQVKLVKAATKRN